MTKNCTFWHFWVFSVTIIIVFSMINVYANYATYKAPNCYFYKRLDYWRNRLNSDIQI